MANFKLNPNPTFWVKTKVRAPGGEQSEFEVEYRHKGKAALQAFLESAKGREESDVIADIVVSWRGMDVDYSPENLKTMLDNYPGMANLMLIDYSVELNKARAGN